MRGQSSRVYLEIGCRNMGQLARWKKHFKRIFWQEFKNRSCRPSWWLDENESLPYYIQDQDQDQDQDQRISIGFWTGTASTGSLRQDKGWKNAIAKKNAKIRVFVERENILGLEKNTLKICVDLRLWQIIISTWFFTLFWRDVKLKGRRCKQEGHTKNAFEPQTIDSDHGLNSLANQRAAVEKP